MKSAKLSFVLNDFSFGIDWASPALAMDKRSLSECINFNITKARSLEKRGGIAKLYSTPATTSTEILSLYEYKAPNATNYLLVAVGNKIKYYSGGWVTIQDNLTTGRHVSFCTHLGSCYAVNGADANMRFYNTTANKLGIATPTTAPTMTDNGSGSLTNKWRYAYAYKRSSGTKGPELIGNYIVGAAAFTTSGTGANVQVSYTASTDPQVDYIVLYRTLSLLLGDSSVYYKLAEVANETSHYHDTKTDNELTTAAEDNNAPPPVSYFVCLHKDRVFYANCPSETNGSSLVCWSKVGKGEAVPSTNYQYFDRDDGEPITGIVGISDYLLVFKRNKIFVLAGGLTSAEDSTLYTIGRGVGCISPYAIVAMEDGVIFLSEEGLKFCDGKNYYNISSRINAMSEDGYFSPTNKNLFSAVYYPDRYQIHFLLRHSILADYFLVGHFLTPLLTMIGESEQEKGPYVAWTLHNYAKDITALGTYTNSDGLTKLCAGTSDGFVYQLDSGINDDGASITYSVKSGWTNLGVPSNFTKTIRMTTISYLAPSTDTFSFTLDADFINDAMPESLSGQDVAYYGSAYCGSAYCGSVEQTYDVWSDKTAKLFRYGINGNNDGPLEIIEISSQFRVEGMR